MIKRLLLLALVGVAGFAIWGIIAQKSSKIPAAPPLAGSMQNFTPTASRGPALQGALISRDNVRKQLRDFRGKLVLLNFWATWCAPCIREMPSLLRLQMARGGDAFTVLALAEDIKGWEKVTPFLTAHSLDDLPVYVDDGGRLGRTLRITGLPASVLLDREGREIGRLTGIAEWDSEEAIRLIEYYANAGRPD